MGGTRSGLAFSRVVGGGTGMVVLTRSAGVDILLLLLVLIFRGVRALETEA